MRDHVFLFINGNPVRAEGEQAFLTLSEFLRQEQGLIGTKIVCAEGDCGACSALVGRPSADRTTFAYQCIDSCIVFMHQLDQTHVISVEGLSAPEAGTLTAVQKAMVRCHSSQCGFCTPGFVVAMHALCEENFCEPSAGKSQRLDEDTLRLGLTGNLCRCTGYVQILQAGKSLDAADVVRMNHRYPPLPMIERFSELADQSTKLKLGDQTVLLPCTLAEAIQMKSTHPQARIVSGATDVGVWYNHGQPSTSVSIGLGGIRELTTVMSCPNALVVGAGVTWTRLIDEFADAFPEMVSILLRFGSPQIRNIGTLGGNLVNASPIADSIPFLMAIDATLNLVSKRGPRSVAINDFYLGYKQIDLQPNELLESIVCPRLKWNQRLKLYKISKRPDMDISTFTAAILLTMDCEVITDARIALGGVGPTVLRTKTAEAFLRGKAVSIETMRAAGKIARNEISAISDVRGSEEYRQQLAENIFEKCFYDLGLTSQSEEVVS